MVLYEFIGIYYVDVVGYIYKVGRQVKVDMSFVY